MNQILHEQLKTTAEESLRKTQTPGAAIAIRINGDSFFEAGIGYQDLNHTVPMLSDANFYIYSVTKSLLAAATLNLVSKGTLDLDLAARSYLPDFSLNAAITPRYLLSHTSGLPDYGGMSAYSDAVKTTPAEPWSRETFLDLIQSYGLRFVPGTDWAYSNLGYLVLRCILERITGLSMQQLLKQVIFSPLGLQRTFVSNAINDAVHLTPGYTRFFSGAELQDMTSLYHPGWVAHGVVTSTAPELAKTIESLFLNQILDAALVEQMLSPVHILGKYPLFEKLAYALGLFTDLESMISGHTGEGPGYSVAAFHFPNLAGSRITIAAVTNQDKADQGLTMVYRIAGVLKESL